MAPVGARREHDWSGTRDGPVPRSSGHAGVPVREPAVAEDFKLEVGSIIQISLKGQRLSLFAPEAEQPLYRNGARAKTNNDPGVLKPVSCKMQVRLQTTCAKPARLQDPTLAGAGGFHPTQRQSTLAAVVVRKIEVPQAEKRSHTQRVNENGEPHKLL